MQDAQQIINTNGSGAPKKDFDAPSKFGTREEIKAIAERMRRMMPGAQLAPWQQGDPVCEQNLENALYTAAQLVVFYGLVPAKDVHILSFGKEFPVDVGVQAWQKAAGRYCHIEGVTYHPHFEEMPADMLRKRHGEQYTDEDYGAICYLWRSDKVEAYELFGARESMTKGYGSWAAKAYKNKKTGVWEPDQIQAHRTKEDVARRRALKHALTIEFSLDTLLAVDPYRIGANLQETHAQLDDYETEHAIMPRHEAEIDEDGIFVKTERRKPEPEPESDLEPEPAEFEVWPEVNFTGDDEPEEAEYRDATWDSIFEGLPFECSGAAKWLRSGHRQSMKRDERASMAAYNYACQVLDRITSVDRSHIALMSVLAGDTITGGNRPGRQMVQRILDSCVANKMVMQPDGKKKRQENPNYRADVVGQIGIIFEHCP